MDTPGRKWAHQPRSIGFSRSSRASSGWFVSIRRHHVLTLPVTALMALRAG